MSDYKTQYEEYKKDLLNKRWFISKLHDLYRGSLNAEKDYIDRNSIFTKLGILSGAVGFCWAFCLSLDNTDKTALIVLRIVMGIIGVACFFISLYVCHKFKKDSGEINFYAFRYNQYFADHIKEEKDREARSLINDMVNYNDALLWRAESIPNMSEEDVKSLLLNHIKRGKDFNERFRSLDRYDRFISDIKNDYYFNAEIQKDIDKYI